MLFKLIMDEILSRKLPLREQFEIMYVKCVLKPVITTVNKGKEEPISEDNKALSDTELDPPPEKEDSLPSNPDPSNHIFEMSFTFLVEIVLGMSAEDLGLLFLIYDC